MRSRWNVVVPAIWCVWYCALAMGQSPDVELVQAVQRNDVAAVDRLLDEGADLSVVVGNAEGLLAALTEDRLPLAEALLYGGASPDQSDEQGRTALMHAAAAGHAQLLDLLLHVGADPALRDAAGRTAVQHAAQAGHADIAQRLAALAPAAPAPHPAPTPANVLRPEPGSELLQLTLNAIDGQVIELRPGRYKGPVAAQGITLTIRPAEAVDDAAPIIIEGDAAKSQAIALAQGANARLTLDGITFAFDGQKQIGVLASGGAHVEARRIRLDHAPSHVIFGQGANTTLILEHASFTDLKAPAVVALSGASAAVRSSTFTRSANGAITVQGPGKLAIAHCTFERIAGNPVVALKAQSLTVDHSTFTRCPALSIAAQDTASVAVRRNRFVGSGRAVDIQRATAPISIVNNHISEVPADSDGIHINTQHRALVAGNTLRGGQVGIVFAGQSHLPLVAVRNEVHDPAKQAILITATRPKNGHAVRLTHNRLLGSTTSTVLLVEGPGRVIALRNHLLATGPSGMAISFQRGASGLLRENVTLGSRRSINFYEADADATQLIGDLLVGQNGWGETPPAMDAATTRLLVMLNADPAASQPLRDVAARLAAAPDATAQPLWAALHATVSALRERGGQLASVRMTIEDSIGRREAVSFDVYQSLSAALGRPALMAEDLRSNAWANLMRTSDAQDALAPVRIAIQQHLQSEAANLLARLAQDAAVADDLAAHLTTLIEGPMLLSLEQWNTLKPSGDTQWQLESYRRMNDQQRSEGEGLRLRAFLNRRAIEHAVPGGVAPLDPVARVDDPAGMAYLSAGAYWVVPREMPSLIETVSLAVGEQREVVARADDTVWFRFWRREQPARRMLLRLRSVECMRDTLAALRRPSVGNVVDVAPNYAATPQQREQALQTARAALREVVQPLDYQGAQGPARDRMYREYAARRDYVMRILAVLGQAEDAAAIVNAMAPDMNIFFKLPWAVTIGRIDARLGQLPSGHLQQLLHDEDAQWRGAAGVAMDDLGLRSGHDTLRRYLTEQGRANPWAATEPAFALLDADDAQTLAVMRELWAAITSEQAPNDVMTSHGAMATAIYLLAHGSHEDRAAVTAHPLHDMAAFHVALLVEDPMPVVEHLIERGLNTSVRNLTAGFRERGEAEGMHYAYQAMLALARHAAATGPRGAYETSLNTSQAYCAFHMPSKKLVEFFGPFGNITRITPSDDESARDLLGVMSWFPEDELLDGYLSAWTKNNRWYETQLEHIDIARIDTAIKAGGAPTPPGHELYLAARQVSDRTYRHALDIMPPRGGRRWAYTLRHHELNDAGSREYGGGISGVATVVPRRTVDRLLVDIHLQQQVHYHDIGSLAGMIDRAGNHEAWAHHRYSIDQGRPLIERVWLRRGDEVIEAVEFERDGAGRFRFAAPWPASSAADWHLGVTMRWFDQTFSFIEPLYAGQAARLHHRAQEDVAALNEIAQRQPSSVAVHVALAEALADTGDVEAMWSAWRSALALRPSDANLWRSAAAAFAQSGMPEQAGGVMLEAVNANPQSIPLWRDLVDRLIRAGNYQLAAEAAAKAQQLTIDPVLAEAQGLALFLAGHDAAAAQAIAALPDAQRTLPLLVAWYVASKGEGDAATALKQRRDALAWNDPQRAVFDALLNPNRQASVSQMWDSPRRCEMHMLVGYRLLLNAQAEAAAAQFTLAVATPLRQSPQWMLAAAGLARTEISITGNAP